MGRGGQRPGFWRDGGRCDRGHHRRGGDPLLPVRDALPHLLAAAAVIVLLYLLNRFLLLPRTGGWVRVMLSGYWADVLAGALMVLLICGGLLVLRHPPLSPLGATAFLLLCGLFWEGITPLYLPRSVGDPLDLLAYWLGGMALLPWVRHLLLRRRN